MAKYRKKPVIIDAVQFLRRFDWPEWFREAVTENKIIVYGTGKFANPNEKCYAKIETLEGTMRAQEGDYIIKGINNEFYPCKPDIFMKTYELVK